jgi:hypothetical protein
LGFLVAFTAAYNIKMLDSGYQTIDMHCIVLHVKIGGRLLISVLRNKQLFKKNEDRNFKIGLWAELNAQNEWYLKNGVFID